jgi:hypothetical protein
MSILSTLAQYGGYYTDPYYSNPTPTLYGQEDQTAAAVAALLFMVITFFIVVVLYVLIALCLMRIFKKAGVKPWIAWVPFYNHWKMLEIGGQQGFWAILVILPFVNIVSAIFLYIAMYNIGLKFHKEGAYVLFAIFLAPVWFILMALDKTPWDESKGAPSLAPETANAPKAKI